MERMTLERVNGIKTGYWSPKTKEEIVQRLAEYENTGLTAAEFNHYFDVSQRNVDHYERESLKFERENTKLKKRIEALEAAASPWIPTTERLPEIGQRVIICRQKEKGVPYIEQATMGPGGWWKVYGTNVKQVDFWMPMPEPPEEVRA